MKTTKTINTIVVAAMGLLLSAAISQAALDLSLGAGASTIQFNGTAGSFQLNPARLATGADPTASLSFQFPSPVMNPTGFTSGHGRAATSHRADKFTPVPEAGTTLAGAGALALVLFAMLFRSRRSSVIRMGPMTQ